jgi:aspartyl protease family protein
MFYKAALLTTVCCGVAIGFFWPASQGSSAARGNGDEVVLERSPDHHYYVDAQVDGKPVHFMVDTGASETALTEDDARAVGIKFDPSQYEVLGDGASGIVRGQYVSLKTLDLDGIRQANAKAVVVPGAKVSLLGQPFLETIDEIVIRKDEMRLRTGGASGS